MKDTISQATDSDPKSLKSWYTLQALLILFFIVKSHNLHYMLLKILSNKANKKLGPINNVLKIQKTSL